MAGTMTMAEPPTKRPLWKQLYLQVIVAITLGALIGYVWPETGEALKPLGDAFIKLVKMIIAPVIFLTVVTGIAGMRNLGKVGSVTLKAFAYFIVVSSFALVVGLTVANVVQPGAGMNIGPATLENLCAFIARELQPSMPLLVRVSVFRPASGDRATLQLG